MSRLAQSVTQVAVVLFCTVLRDLDGHHLGLLPKLLIYIPPDLDILGRPRRNWDGLMESCTCHRRGPPPPTPC